MVRLFAELVEESIILVFLEMKLALFEVKKQVRSAEKGTVMMALGAALLLFALVTFVATAVAALAVILPVWLSALIVALTLTFCGVAFLFSGLGNLKEFSFIPAETVLRVQNIVQKLKMASAQRKAAEEGMAPEVGTTPERRLAPERRTAYERRTVRLGRIEPERRSASERRTAARARRSSATAQRPGRSELKQKAA